MPATIKIHTSNNHQLKGQLITIIQLLDDLEKSKRNRSIEFDFSKIDFLHPFTILVLKGIIQQIIFKGVEVTFKNAKYEILGYLDAINFYKDLKPDLLIDWMGLLNNFKSKTYLPIIHFNSGRKQNDTEIRNKVLSTINNLLQDGLKLDTNFKSTVSYLISELTDNIVDHAEVERGMIMAQFYPSNKYIDICILDNGLTLKGSYLKHNHKVKNDLEAVTKAYNGLSTKNKERGRGIPTSYDMIIKGLGGEFCLMSGNGLILNNDFIEMPVKYNGTIAAIRIPSKKKNFIYTNYV